jgi:hypothetical protein
MKFTNRPALAFFALTVFMLSSCKKEAETTLASLDLLPYGMPIVIQAPENPVIKLMDLVLSRDITVIKEPDFNLQIFESDADTRDISVIKGRLMQDVKSNPYFHEILRDDPAGFVYETHVDSNYINYGFRYARIQGDKEYVFQQGLRGKFTREAIEIMYGAVQ